MGEYAAKMQNKFVLDRKTNSGNSIKTGFTSESSLGLQSILQSQSVTSLEQKATNLIKNNGLTSTVLNGDEHTVNMHSELYNSYNTELKQCLEKCILNVRPQVSFSDIAGCHFAKECINMSFVVPHQCPDLFAKTNIRPI